jgi:hypothetical protein
MRLTRATIAVIASRNVLVFQMFAVFTKIAKISISK